jgi:antitoxin ParD1/3/4
MATQMHRLNVSITRHFSDFIRRKVKSGRYSNASEVVRDALWRLQQEEERQYVVLEPDNVYEELLKGKESIERGEGIVLETQEDLDAFLADIIVRGRQRLKAGKKRRKS